MKRVLNHLLILMALLITLTTAGCSENNIKLTESNYDDYLEVTFNISGEGYFLIENTDSYIYMIITVNIKGASDNYDYHDIVLSYAIEGEYYHPDNELHRGWNNFSQVLSVNCNIGGNGSSRIKFTESQFPFSTTRNVRYIITEISGYVTKV